MKTVEPTPYKTVTDVAGALADCQRAWRAVASASATLWRLSEAAPNNIDLASAEACQKVGLELGEIRTMLAESMTMIRDIIKDCR
jgi:hypothetical protein